MGVYLSARKPDKGVVNMNMKIPKIFAYFITFPSKLANSFA
jgi:hypothetical protein